MYDYAVLIFDDFYNLRCTNHQNVLVYLLYFKFEFNCGLINRPSKSKEKCHRQINLTRENYGQFTRQYQNNFFSWTEKNSYYIAVNINSSKKETRSIIFFLKK